ncbi:zinc metalloproteinase nas-29-like isoform X2 [Paramacrobiotus metropolitanus]|nr:zinc metalloproteinase nas-29-like isoform X2 [Paramacrobiotus metropolitanus]
MPENYWPNNGKNIPYQISHEFDTEQSSRIRQGLQKIQARTFACITFINKTTETDFIFFKPSRLCQSRVGKHVNGGRHDIELSNACVNHIGIIQHEVLHALGLFHEQNRPDRDAYVEIFYDNIQPDFVFNFRLLSAMEVYGTMYDLDSIMHYGGFDFAKVRSRYTIRPKNKKRVRMGQRKGLSTLDVTKLHNAYQCTFDSDNEVPDDGDLVTTSKSVRTSPPGSAKSMTTAVTDSSASEQFPEFSMEPMTREQCAFQFRSKCGRQFYTQSTCKETKGLEIDCKGLTTDELRDMVERAARPPVRAIRLDLDDGRHLQSEIFRPIRLQIIGFELWNCKTNRTTEKLWHLRFSRMYHFELVKCQDLVVRKSDFDNSKNLRMILFRDSTIAELEDKTFMNLPELLVLSLEYERIRSKSIPSYQQDFIGELHCSCQFAWLRTWYSSRPSLLHGREKGAVYSVVDAFQSPEVNADGMYRPYNCQTKSYHTHVSNLPFSTHAC